MRHTAPEPPEGLLRRSSAPAFSIVIASYQAAETIVESVESALAQSLPAHEVIVIDDGSTDRTGEVLKPYLDRIRYLPQSENRGAPAASNIGLRSATGEYISILDADDVYEPRRIEALTDLAMIRPDLDILMTDAYLDRGGEVAGRFSEATPFPAAAQELEIYDRCFIAEPAVRRATMLAIGGFNESLPIGYDHECWIRMLHAGSRAGLVNEPLMRYRITGRQSLTDNRVAALRSRVQVLELVADLDLTAGEREALERALVIRRQAALLAEAQLALRERTTAARRMSLAVARERGMPLALRIRALAAAVAPGLAASTLEEREARTGRSRIRRDLPGAR